MSRVLSGWESLCASSSVLRFVDINSDPAAVREFSRPWTKIE